MDEAQQAGADIWRDKMRWDNISGAPEVGPSIYYSSDHEVFTLKAAMTELINNMIPKVVLAENDTEFEAQYQAMIDAMISADLDKMLEYYKAGTEYYVDRMAESGFVLK